MTRADKLKLNIRLLEGNERLAVFNAKELLKLLANIRRRLKLARAALSKLE